MYLAQENKCSIIKTIEYTNNILHINTEKQSIYITFENEKDARAAYNHILTCLKFTHLTSIKHIKDIYPKVKVMIC